MTNILIIHASPRRTNSISSKLALHFRQTLAKTGFPGKVVERALTDNPPAFVSQEWIAAAFTPEDQRNQADQAALAQSDIFIDEVAAADHIVVATPMYNYGMPAILKAWIDQVVRINRTFSFDLARGDWPLEPTLSGKSMLVLSSRGEFGFHEGVRSQSNHLDPHLATCAGYLGVAKDAIETIAVEYQEFKDARHRASLEQAMVATERAALEIAGTAATEPGFQSSGHAESAYSQAR